MIRTYQIINSIALVSTLVINYLSNTGIFNGQTMSSISERYNNLFTPAGYAFSIWGLIYLGLLGFVIYYGPFTKDSEEKNKIIYRTGSWFIISCIANSFWIVCWLNDYLLASVLLMILLFISLLKIITLNFDTIKSLDFRKKVFFSFPFSIYAGWVSVALIANIAAYLQKIEWNTFGISHTAWTVIMITIALIVHLFMIWKKNMNAFAVVAVWALSAIAVANNNINYVVFLYSILTSIVVLVNILYTSLVKKKIVN